MKRAILFLLAVLTYSASAQVPSVISYQGRVQVSGTNFSGTGQFKFALVSRGTNTSRQATATANLSGPFVVSYSVTDGGAGYLVAPAVTVSGGGGSGATATANVSGGVVTSISPNNAGSGYTSPPTVTVATPPDAFVYGTFWSNDGTSTAGSEPASTVTISVQQGLFNVFLGDAALANMQAIPPAVFTYDDVRLRIWFSTGGGFTQLTPDQRLGSVGYAMTAAQYNGPIADNQLPANITRLDAPNQTFTAPVNFSSQTSAFSGSFNGDGAGVTNVNLGALNSGGAIGVISNPVFYVTATLNVGAGPRSVIAEDVNGDGYKDLISANNNVGTLSVLTNNGGGQFTLASSPTVGNGPQIVTTADVNGDGYPDLINANGNVNTLSVLTNNGKGGFSLSSSPTVGANPYPVVAADVNGDARVDLISGNFGAATLSVLTNTGNGTFALAGTPAVGGGPHGLTAADINGDGSIDLISTATFIDALTVLTNNGRGVFALASSLPLTPGSYPLWVIAPDVNGDGRKDLVSANFYLNTLSVLTNNGLGGFALASSPGAGSYPHSIVAADIDRDGRPDLVCANQSGSLSVITNGGTGIFALQSTVVLRGNPSSVAGADLNGDGTLEFITANYVDPTLSVVAQSLYRFYGTFNGIFNGNVSGTFSGNASGTFAGNGNSLTNLNATALVGDVPDANLSPNVVLYSNPAFGNQVTASGGLRLNNANLWLRSGSDANHGLGWFGSGKLFDGVNVNGPVLFGNGGGALGTTLAGSTTNIALIWTSSGRVGIGTNTPGYTLEVSGTAGKPGGGSWSSSSDARLKKDVRPLTGVLDKLLALRGVTFQYKEPEKVHELSGERIGMIAQEVEKVFPDWVETGPDGFKRLTFRGFEALTVEGLRQLRQEQKAEMEAKDAKIAALEKEMEALKSLFQGLSNKRPPKGGTPNGE